MNSRIFSFLLSLWGFILCSHVINCNNKVLELIFKSKWASCLVLEQQWDIKVTKCRWFNHLFFVLNGLIILTEVCLFVSQHQGALMWLFWSQLFRSWRYGSPFLPPTFFVIILKLGNISMGCPWADWWPHKVPSHSFEMWSINHMFKKRKSTVFGSL